MESLEGMESDEVLPPSMDQRTKGSKSSARSAGLWRPLFLLLHQPTHSCLGSHGGKGKKQDFRPKTS